MSDPQIAYVSRDGSVPVHAPRRRLPLVIVPGTGGTRLIDPATGKLAWNPQGFPLGDDPGEFTCDNARIMQTSLELVPDETHTYDRQSWHEEVQHIRHFYNLAAPFYGNLARKLAQHEFVIDGVAIEPVVYVAGYDWRLDPAKSALRVAEVVDEALRETRERQVVMFSHSQGAIVARYYQRALGGESKVFAYFNIAGASIGFPNMFIMLKNGLEGLNPLDFANDLASGNSPGAVFEGLNAGSEWMAGDGPVPLDAVYGAACIGAGRLLTRYETKYFWRSLPAMYAMAPNAVFCQHYPDWCHFDPFATGYPAVGKMLQFPTLLDAGIQAAGGIVELLGRQSEKVVEQVKQDAARFFSRREEDGEFALNSRATKNVETLADKMKAGDYRDVYERVDRMFVDGRNARVLYTDIYTGLLDIPEWRAMCAANLELAFAVHDALTINPRMPEPKSPTDLVEGVLKGFAKAIGGGDAVETNWMEVILDTFEPDGKMLLFKGKKTRLDIKNRERQEALWGADQKPKAYMHPRTYCVYTPNRQTQQTCMILPTRVESRDDSNLVESQLLVDAVVRYLTMKPRGNGGDHRIDIRCACPDAALLSNDFVERKELDNVGHDMTPVDEVSVRWMIEKITDFLPEFLCQ